MADEASGSGASDCIPIQAGALKKGSHVVLKGFPCKIVDYSCVSFALFGLCLVFFSFCAVSWMALGCCVGHIVSVGLLAGVVLLAVVSSAVERQEWGGADTSVSSSSTKCNSAAVLSSGCR